MLTILPVLAFLVVFAILGSAMRSKSKRLDAFRSEATDQFETWLAGDSARQLGLGPGHCDIVKREETIGNDEGQVWACTLTLFLRGDAGQYVMFKSTPSGPYVKLVAPSVAKVVLKDKYVET